MAMKILHTALVLFAALSVSLPASAVYLNPDGKGQALIYSYYTARPANGNLFNTLLSLVNHTADAKVIRVRFREGRNAREVASFNLFLSPNDMWTGAVVPAASGDGTRVVSTDLSCTSPPFAASGGEPPALAFTNANYQTGDSFGTGLERTREGWLEVTEMATLTGASAAAVAHASNGVPANCGAVQGTPALNLAAPSGGLSGTLTLINVASGEDFTVNAEALAELSKAAFYRPPTDPYPDFNAAEIDPVSVAISDGFIWRSVWSRGIDAVSAAMMRSSWTGEYVLDTGTNSQTDFVVTFPTRHHYLSGTTASPPFKANCQDPYLTYSGEPVDAYNYSREASGGVLPIILSPPLVGIPNFRCGSSGVFDALLLPPAPTATRALGSVNRSVSESMIYARTNVTAGWYEFVSSSGLSLTSLSTSTRMTVTTGVTTAGAHRYLGVPLMGFTVRTFENGTLACSGGACQGNYGGAFPLKYSRSIAPAP